MLDILTLNQLEPSKQRSIYIGLVIAAFILYFGLQTIGYPLWGVAAFVGLFGTSIALVAGSSARLFDERDQQIHEQAAGATLTLYGWICAVAFPTVVALEALDQATFPGWLQPISVGIIVLYLTYVGMQFVIRWRQYP